MELKPGKTRTLSEKEYFLALKVVKMDMDLKGLAGIHVKDDVNEALRTQAQLLWRELFRNIPVPKEAETEPDGLQTQPIGEPPAETDAQRQKREAALRRCREIKEWLKNGRR